MILSPFTLQNRIGPEANILCVVFWGPVAVNLSETVLRMVVSDIFETVDLLYDYAFAHMHMEGVAILSSNTLCILWILARCTGQVEMISNSCY